MLSKAVLVKSVRRFFSNYCPFFKLIKIKNMNKNDKLIISGSCNPGFLKDAIDELETYRTPKNIIDFIKDERLKVIIGNPPYKTD